MTEKKKSPKKKTSKKPAVQKKSQKTKSTETLAATVQVSKKKAKRKKGQPLYVVGIGASAGGFEAFGQFFSNMPSESGMAFVLVPHLDPTHKSIMNELLKKYTEMKIFEAEDGMKVEPDCIYVIPPNYDISILHGDLHLIEPVKPRGQRHPIDFFFRSLAEDQGNRAICIVLSGTGTEGTLGLKAIKGEGGLVMVQDTESAKYDGMPRSAISTGLVDYIFSADKMPEQLMNYARGIEIKQKKREKKTSEITDAMQKVFVLIRSQTGHDFSRYKRNTIVRRIERRMAIHQIETISDYIRYLRKNSLEVELLFKELLIRVTQFFRDPKAYEALKEKVLAPLLEKHSDDLPVRVWVPGCSTGEEAYSLAMILQEYLHEVKQTFKLQVFATDLDHEAIEKARQGLFPDTIDADVSPERLKQFFIKQENRYKIKDEIREITVFAAQNIIKDPPFSKIDLISCRNLMIYLGPELQRKVLSIFHYALNPEGVLFLGTSESIGESSDLFSVVDNKWKIFSTKGKVPHPYHPATDFPPVLSGRNPARIKQAPEGMKTGEVDVGGLMKSILLESYTPSSVIVNESGDILYFHGHTGNYLEPAEGKASLNILQMARVGLKRELKKAIRQTINQKTETVVDRVQVRTDGEVRPVKIVVKPFREPPSLRGLFMVIFEETTSPKSAKAAKKSAYTVNQAHQRIDTLEMELSATKEHLQTSIEELETMNEELQSTNEELQSSNEELQSTNEELETSKEELQSVNEELMTVNSEHQNKIEELSLSNNDMINLLASTQVATLFLNMDLCIKRFTPEMTRIIKLIPTDLGRPIGDIVSTLIYQELEQDLKQVLKTLVLIEKEVQDKEGAWYQVKVMPYRTVDNMIDGVVVTFVDVTEQKEVQASLQDALGYSENIFDTVREPLLVLDPDLIVVSANKAFYKTFHVSAKETVNRRIYELGNRQWNTPKLKELLEEILPKNSSFDDFEVDHDFRR